MTRHTKARRRLELLEIVRTPCPLDYPTAPQNRLQRRVLEKALRSQARGRQKAPIR